MFNNSNIIIKEIVYANHIIGNKKGSHTQYATDSYSYYQLLYKLSGEAMITYNNKTVVERAGDLRFLPNPSLFEKPPLYTADVIEEGESINIAFVTDSPLPEEITVKTYTCSSALKGLFNKMQKHWYYKHDGYYYKSLSLLYEILAVILSAEAEYISSKEYNKIYPAIDYIDHNFTKQNIDCEYLATLCNLSHTYMSKLFKKHFGVSPVKYIISKKIQFACDLLNTKYYSIGKIAELSGFTNTYYFSRIFKKQMSISPSEFAKRHTL